MTISRSDVLLGGSLLSFGEGQPTYFVHGSCHVLRGCVVEGLWMANDRYVHNTVVVW